MQQLATSRSATTTYLLFTTVLTSHFLSNSHGTQQAQELVGTNQTITV